MPGMSWGISYTLQGAIFMDRHSLDTTSMPQTGIVSLIIAATRQQECISLILGRKCLILNEIVESSLHLLHVWEMDAGSRKSQLAIITKTLWKENAK